MTELVEKALSHLSQEDAEQIRKKHSDEYVVHYYKRALTHENSGKVKGEFSDYLLKLLTKDKAKFYEKAERKKEIIAQKTEQKRKAKLKVQRRIAELKDREKLTTEGFKRAKTAFRELPELEQARHIKRVQKQNPDKSFNQCRDMAVMVFYNGR